MKAMMILVGTFFLLCNTAVAQGLVTGKTKYKFEPGDRVLIDYDFHQCPVGEMPSGFDKITGAVECVKYNNHIWVAPSTRNPVRLYKKMELGSNAFSIEFDMIALKSGTQLEFRLLYGTHTKDWKKENFFGSQPFDLKYRAWGWDKKGSLRLEGAGDIGQVQNAPKKVVHVGIMVRRHQYRVFVDGKRLVSVPFGKHVHGIEFIYRGDIQEYGMLFSNVRPELKAEPDMVVACGEWVLHTRNVTIRRMRGSTAWIEPHACGQVTLDNQGTRPCTLRLVLPEGKIRQLHAGTKRSVTLDL